MIRKIGRHYYAELLKIICWHKFQFLFYQPIFQIPFSAPTLLFGQQEGHPAGCWFVGGDDLSGGCLIVVTTTSITLSSNKSRMEILW